jgi:hypothetical protein
LNNKNNGFMYGDLCDMGHSTWTTFTDHAKGSPGEGFAYRFRLVCGFSVGTGWLPFVTPNGNPHMGFH